LAEYENADAILCPSHFVKKSFASQGFPKENIFVVPYGFYPPAIFEKAAPKGDVFRVLYVGQIHFRKGLRYLVQAFERLRVPKKELLLVGPRTQDTGLADLALPGNVRFCGVARGEELALLYQSATVFVQPSIEEGLSLVLAEALSYGLPVIATENTGARDLFTDGVEGFIVPIRDPDVIADKLELLAGKNELRRGMGEQAGKRARAIGGWEESGKLLVQTLRTICGRG
jgi:glycosyltransferase involved in cell wall biosynthesis